MKKQQFNQIWLILLLFLIGVKPSTAQQVWYFGHKAGIKFNGSLPPVAYGTSLTNPINTSEGCAMVHDVMGNVLLSTDGSYVYDKTNTVMPNANGDLKGGPSATQSAIVVPVPGCNCNKYFVFTVASLSGGNDANHPETAGLCYSVVDLGLNGGNGDIIAATKNTQLVGMAQTGLFNGYSSEKITAVKDGTGGFWVLAHGVNRNGNNYNAKRFYAFHITSKTIGNCSSPTISTAPANCITTDVGSDIINGLAIGQMKFSSNAQKIAYATWSGNSVEVFDFNSSTGVVSNNKSITGFVGQPYGVEFSPNNNYLYATETYGSSSHDLYQFDLAATNLWTSRVSIHTEPASSTYIYGSLQLWTDGKIYVANSFDGKIGVIQSPNLAGTAANYIHNAIALPTGTISHLSLPTVIQGFTNCGDTCAQLSVLAQRDSCCYNIEVTNNFDGNYFTNIVAQTNSLNISNATTTSSSIFGVNFLPNSHTATYSTIGQNSHIPLGAYSLGNICFDGAGNDTLTLKFVGNPRIITSGPDSGKILYDTVCTKKIPIVGCGKPTSTSSCVSVLNQVINCDSGVLTMSFQLKNNSDSTLRAVTLYTANPDVTVAGSNFIPMADLPKGATSPILTIPITVKNNATNGCFYFSACNQNIPPGIGGLYPTFCCLDSIQYCAPIPSCNPCDAITLTAVKDTGTDCCFQMTMNNSFNNSMIKCLHFRGLNGTQFALFSGWSIVGTSVSSSNVTICPPGAGLSHGTYSDFARFCLTGTSPAPHQVEVEIMDTSGKVMCTKILSFDNCNLVKPTCANIINDSMYCDGAHTKYTFSVKNNSPFPLYQVDVRTTDPLFHVDTNIITPATPIAVGATGGPYTVTIDTLAGAGSSICLYLTGHNALYNPAAGTGATQCCTDAIGKICLPFLHCDNGTTSTCCAFASLTIPNGITPNNDGYNDAFVIGGAAKCSCIGITVYNQWGNVVFKEDNYANNWKGTNQAGHLLPQGTYYILIKLCNGAEKTVFIDIRY